MANPRPHAIHTKSSQEELGEEKLKEIKKESGELKDKTAELLQDAINDLKEHSDDAKTVVKEYVKENPFKALGIALLAGVAVSLFLRR